MVMVMVMVPNSLHCHPIGGKNIDRSFNHGPPILKVLRNMDLNLESLLAIYGIFILMPEISMGSNHCCAVVHYSHYCYKKEYVEGSTSAPLSVVVQIVNIIQVPHCFALDVLDVAT